MKNRDDRVNFSGPCLILKERDHEIIDSLPFDANIPVIGGLNALRARKGATLLLSAVEFEAGRSDATVEFKARRRYPLLVVGGCQRGRTAAFASDSAPHWVGPFIDWGNRRIKAQAEGAEMIEVGSGYAEFFKNLIEWLCAGYNDAVHSVQGNTKNAQG